jgi:TldD protein
MRQIGICCAAAAFLCCAGSLLTATDVLKEVKGDTQLRAMMDELNRSKTLQISNLDKPYFVEYTTSDAENAFITGSLGGLTSSSHVHIREPRIQVRVGDYKFDNTNSIYTTTARLGMFPVDDDYGAMRSDLWLSTDGLYKASADQITRKRTALREIADADNTPDLAPAKPVQIVGRSATMNFDQKHWEEAIRQLSGRFANHPNVTNSHIRLRAISSTYRLVNTEGSVVRIPQEMTDIEVVANGVAPDGSRIWNHRFFTMLRASQLPSPDVLGKSVDALATETEALTKAPAAEEYSGPVLFEQEAAAEMMAQVLADAVRLQRKPLAPPGAENRFPMVDSVWSSRLGAKVMPEWLTVIDNPRAQEFEGTSLAGYYEVDDEGVPSEKVTLVDKGTLKGFLFSRQPIRTFNASNGHGRLPGGFGAEAAVIGNLFVQADQTISEAQLKAKLLEKVKAAGLKYGVIIRSLDFPSTASLQELQSLARQLQRNGYTRTLNMPLLAFRVYADGREELVRGVRFKEFSAKDLRDVDAASDHPYVLNYVNNGSGFNLMDSSGDATTSSVICPSLLFDNLDLARVEEEAGRLPLVPPPALISDSSATHGAGLQTQQ